MGNRLAAAPVSARPVRASGPAAGPRPRPRHRTEPEGKARYGTTALDYNVCDDNFIDCKTR